MQCAPDSPAERRYRTTIPSGIFKPTKNYFAYPIWMKNEEDSAISSSTHLYKSYETSQYEPTQILGSMMFSPYFFVNTTLSFPWAQYFPGTSSRVLDSTNLSPFPPPHDSLSSRKKAHKTQIQTPALNPVVRCNVSYTRH